MAAKKAAAKGVSVEEQIRKLYGRNKNVISRGSGEPGDTGPVSRKKYVSAFQDVIAESSIGNYRGAMNAAARIATSEWNNTFGPKKAAAKKAMPAKTMPLSKKK
jgi:hypothetical protein